MVDVSFNNGGSITITANGVPTTITDFPYEEDPFSVEEVEVVGHQFTLNNELFRWRKPAAYIVRVAVLANSANDETLQKHLEATKHDTEEDQLVDWEKLAVTMDVVCIKSKTKKDPDDKEKASDYVVYSFSDGCLISGSPCMSVDSEGKINANRYSFVFGTLSRT